MNTATWNQTSTFTAQFRTDCGLTEETCRRIIQNLPRDFDQPFSGWAPNKVTVFSDRLVFECYPNRRTVRLREHTPANIEKTILGSIGKKFWN